MSVRDAILEAGRVRLRPIVMTTVTTILGLLPMAVGIGEGSELRSPMAITVIGGLIVATGLTLVVVPVVYQTMEGVAERARAALGMAAAAGAGD
jgi:HAE1 family hydrophobic/amphiphilic exporter-1